MSGAGRGGAGQWAGSGAGRRKLGGLGRGPRKAPPGAAKAGTAARGVSHFLLRRWSGDWTRNAQVGPGARARVGGWGIGPGTRRRSTERWAAGGTPGGGDPGISRSPVGIAHLPAPLRARGSGASVRSAQRT